MRNAQAHSTETETFEKRLRAYAAGAGAVAAGLLAFAPSAEAEVVVAQPHVTIQRGTSFSINIDGTTAFTLTEHSHSLSSGCFVASASLFATEASGAGMVGHGRNQQVAALKFGAVIGPADQFEAGKQELASGLSCKGYGWSVYGPLANTKDRFLGFKFELNGQVYYGWAGFGLVFPAGLTGGGFAVLTAYAYETEPNSPW